MLRLLLLVTIPVAVHQQFLNYNLMRERLPGRCAAGDFDCGLGHCVPSIRFHDGRPDCFDGSDEWCLIGQISCGSYCADFKDTLPCLVNPRCDGSEKQLPWCSISKEKICGEEVAFPCKGYGECVHWEWLLDGKNDCIDDEQYVMALEHGFRATFNRSGIFLPKLKLPEASIDGHGNKFVPGCSYCAGSTSSSPTPAIQPEIIQPNDPNNVPSVFPPLPDPNMPSTSAPIELVQTTRLNERAMIRPVTNSPILQGFIQTTKSVEYYGNWPIETTTTPKPLPTSSSPTVILPTLIPETYEFQTTEDPEVIFGTVTQPSTWSIPGSSPDSQPVASSMSTSTTSSLPSSSTAQVTPNPITVGVPTPSWRVPEVNPAPETIVPMSKWSNGNPVVPSHVPGVRIGPPHKVPWFPPTTSTSSVSYGGEWGSQTRLPGIWVNTWKPPTPTKTWTRPTPETRPPMPSGTWRPPNSGTWPSPHSGSWTPSTSRPNNGVWIGLPKGIPNAWKPPPGELPRPIPINTGQLPRPGTVIGSVSRPHPSPATTPTFGPWSLPSGPPQPGAGFRPVVVPVVVSEHSGAIDQLLITHRPRLPPRVQEVTPDVETFGGQFIKSTPVTGKTTVQTLPTTTQTVPTIAFTSTTEIPFSTKASSTSSTVSTTESPTIATSESSATTTVVGETNSTMIMASESTITTTLPDTESVETFDLVNSEKGCLQKLRESYKEHEDDGFCTCGVGKWPDSELNCKADPNLTTVKVNVDSICGSEDFRTIEKQRILYSQVKVEKLVFQVPVQLKNTSMQNFCILSSEVDDSIVLLMNCEEKCETSALSIKSKQVTSRYKEFGPTLCSDSTLNNCHHNAECVVRSDGFRYTCNCKNGTTDTSNGTGRSCMGIPDDEDCIVIFGICMIVWMFIILGTFFLTILCCVTWWQVCKNKGCCRNITIHPETSAGVSTVTVGKREKRLVGRRRRERKEDHGMPHMRKIFAESLEHSAKGSSSVASAFALAEFRKKAIKISVPPSIPIVPEEITEGSQISSSQDKPSTSSEKVDEVVEPVPISETNVVVKHSVHSISSLPQISETLKQETPILEKKPSLPSLQTLESAPTLTNVPLPLPIPITTTVDASEKTEKVEKVESGDVQIPVPRVSTPPRKLKSRSPSVHSVGIQPTIWESYRVLGNEPKTEEKEQKRKASVDSLEALFEARLFASRTTSAQPTSPAPDLIMEQPVLSNIKETSVTIPEKQPSPVPTAKVETPRVIPASTSPEEPTVTKSEPLVEPVPKKEEQSEVQPTPLVETPILPERASPDVEKRLSARQQKLAEMLGVDATDMQSASEEGPLPAHLSGTEAYTTDTDYRMGSPLPSLAEKAVLAEMAKRGIALELPVSTSDIDDTPKILKNKNINLPFRVSTSESDSDGRRKVSRMAKSKPPSERSSRMSSSKSTVSQKSAKTTPTPSRLSSGKLPTSRSVSASREAVQPKVDKSVSIPRKTPEVKKKTDEKIFIPWKAREGVKAMKNNKAITKRPSSLTTTDESDPEKIDKSNKSPTKPSTSRKQDKLGVIKSQPRTLSSISEKSGELHNEVLKPMDTSISCPPTTRSLIGTLSPFRPATKIMEVTSDFSDVDIPKQLKTTSARKEILSSPDIPDISMRKSMENLIEEKIETARRRESGFVKSSREQPGSSRTSSRSTRHSVIGRKIATRRTDNVPTISASVQNLSSYDLPTSSRNRRGARSVDSLSRSKSGPKSFPAQWSYVTAPQPAGSIMSPSRSSRSSSRLSLPPRTGSTGQTFWSSPYFLPSTDSHKPPKEDLWWGSK